MDVPSNTSPADGRSWEEDANPLELELDPRNPRLAFVEEGSSQDRLIEIMLDRFKVEELAQSILESGYNSFDPLVGWKDHETIRILEGNRRIAAIKCLLDPGLAPVRIRERWVRLSEALSPQTRQQIVTLRVRVYADKDDPELLAYIGFRHVTGVLTWPALEKAKYIDRLIEEQGWHDYGPIAKRLGSYPSHVERHYVAYRLVRQAAEAEVEGVENMEESFGVLLRALQTAGVVTFLGLTFPGDPAASRVPIAVDHLPQFAEFVLWTFGSDERVKILPESRRLTDWGKILESGQALTYLRSSTRPDFDRAFFLSGGEALALADALIGASFELAEAAPRVAEHVQDPTVKDAVRQCARFLAQILDHFPEVRSEYGFPSRD